jgi:hypothetical protein
VQKPVYQLVQNLGQELLQVPCPDTGTLCLFEDVAAQMVVGMNGLVT